MNSSPHIQSYFNTAIQLLRQYNGAVPLSHYLRQYFAQNKKHGSRDRRTISQLCYTYFRIGHALQSHTDEERLKIALFLCSEQQGEWNGLLNESWVDQWSHAIEVRIHFISQEYPDFSVEDIFPWAHQLSEGIDIRAFAVSHLVQPNLFTRIRPGKEEIVLKKLNDKKIAFEQLSATCLAFPNGSKVDEVLELDREVVIQDMSSQRIVEFIPANSSKAALAVWDCCAASGGKSILVNDTLSNIYITASDIRPSILKNLLVRFKNAGIKKYHSFVCNLAAGSPLIATQGLIICDAPCSGSGTWGRTPEQLYFFTEEKIGEYAELQRKIVGNAVQRLEKGGYLLYITCSVFTAENEKIAASIENEYPLQLIKKEVLTGYSLKADSMFAALFKENG